MNTRTVDPRTIWALVAMELGLALPLISLPTQGDRVPGLLGPLLLVLLLPLGYVAVYQVPDVRDPSWRLLGGIGLALATRAVVSSVTQPDVAGLALWLGRSVVPMAIGIALWWRGTALSAADLTAADIRTEFSVLAVLMLATLSVVRPFLLPDPVLLAGSVAIFALGGLVAMALSRQDAAEVSALGRGHILAALSAVVPVAAAVLLVSILRPELLGAMWTMLARVIELVLTPIGWFFAWLASLLPRGSLEPQAPPRPAPLPPLPDPAALGQLQDRQEWLGWLVLFGLLLLVGGAAMLIVRAMLANWIGTPLERAARPNREVTAERSGTARGDARNAFRWLVRWLQKQFIDRTQRRPHARADAGQASILDAWAAYRSLLEWASTQGLARRAPETTGQLKERLARHSPHTSDAVDLVTTTYERAHYGAHATPVDRLRRVRQALQDLRPRD